jgi:hypothetical protein
MSKNTKQTSAVQNPARNISAGSLSSEMSASREEGDAEEVWDSVLGCKEEVESTG